MFAKWCIDINRAYVQLLCELNEPPCKFSKGQICKYVELQAPWCISSCNRHRFIPRKAIRREPALLLLSFLHQPSQKKKKKISSINNRRHHCQYTTMKKIFCVALVSSLLLVTLAGASSSLTSSLSRPQEKVLGRKGRELDQLGYHYQHEGKHMQQTEVSSHVPRNFLKLYWISAKKNSVPEV